MNDLTKRFYSQPMDKEQLYTAQRLRDDFGSTANHVDEQLPKGRYKDMALMHLETAAMFATKSITHEWKETT